MPDDIDFLSDTLRRVESKVDEVKDKMTEGAREFGEIQADLKNVKERLNRCDNEDRALNNRLNVIQWSIAVTILAGIIKMFLFP